MGRPIHANGKQTRQAILDAALELFAEKGYFGTSLRDIAGAVGVRESGFYNYFDSKESLFNALLASDRENRSEQLAAFFAAPMTDARSTLERLTALVLDYFSEPRQQRLFRVVMCDGVRLAKEGRLDLMEKVTSGAAPFEALMARLMADGSLKPADPELLAAEFLGPLLLWRHRHAVNPDSRLIVNRSAFIRGHVNQFLNGAKVPATATGRAPAEYRKTSFRSATSAERRQTDRAKSVS